MAGDAGELHVDSILKRLLEAREFLPGATWRKNTTHRRRNPRSVSEIARDLLEPANPAGTGGTAQNLWRIHGRSIETV